MDDAKDAVSGKHVQRRHYTSRLAGRGDVMTYPHLTVNARGALCIDGTRHRVIDIVADHVAHGYSAAQIVEQYLKWADKYCENQITIIYDTMWNGTRTRS